MTDNAPPKPKAVDVEPAPEDIPRALVTGGNYAWVLESVLGFIALALGVWYGVRRPTVAVLAVAVLLAGYVVLHLWQRYHEHPDRDPRVRRGRAARGAS